MTDNPKAEPATNYWQDTVDCWHRLPNKWFFFTLLAAWLAMFQFYGNSILGYVHSHSLFTWLYSVWSSPNETNEDSQGSLVPFIVVGLFWWKRKEMLALPLKTWWPGIWFVLAGAVLHIAGYVTQQPRASTVGLFTGIFGLMGLAWGRTWLRKSLFPYWLFVFCVPLAALALPLTFPLRMLATWLTATAANLITIPVIRMGTQIVSPDGSFQYDVAAACSGLHSLVAIFLLAAVYGCVAFKSNGKRVVLMLLALPLSVAGNFVRLMSIILAAEFGGQAAGNYVHEGGPGGVISLLPYVPAILGLLLAGRWMSEKKRDPQPPAAPAQPETTVP